MSENMKKLKSGGPKPVQQKTFGPMLSG